MSDIDALFEQSICPSVVEYIDTYPDGLDRLLEGERRHMTVMFTDIRGFTSMSEGKNPLELGRFLNSYFTAMSDIVMDSGGTVDKYMGDGMMAFWNAPFDSDTHAADACIAALKMTECVASKRDEWAAMGFADVHIGCGINTGAMYSGFIGSDKRKSYTVMGDNVNIASRLEGLNKYYSTGILVTESTKEELDAKFLCRVVDKVRVSGRKEPLRVYEVLSHGPVPEEEYELVATFARVFELYQEREFSIAQSLLNELRFMQKLPLYEMYERRLAMFRTLPPADDWDGTFVMDKK